MSLKIYNTLSRKKEDFVPVNASKVRMYVCGPTVYNYISIGNARPIVVFNMVRNYLKHTGYNVELVQNITDIEDKIINKAKEECVDFNVITSRYIQAFLEDLESLQITDFCAMPKASEMIDEIISIIKKIIENGFAYIADGDVYFDVAKFKDYGKLSGQKVDEMLTQEKDSFSKKNKIDFTLWKSAKPGEPYWDSPWGNGRPGWHIECSAMSLKHLDWCLDIHGGGIDLVFPHHENEIAQSEAAFPQRGDFVKYWMHNGMIEVKAEKMSKSSGLKKDWILRNLLEKYPADVVKIYMLATHYRSPLEFSDEKLIEAKKAYDRIINFLRNLEFLTGKDTALSFKSNGLSSVEGAAFGAGTDDRITALDTGLSDDELAVKVYDYIKKFNEGFKISMDDDFNSARAIGIMFDFIGNVNSIVQHPGFEINAPIVESLKIVKKVLVEHAGIFGFELKDKSKTLPDDSGKTKEFFLDKDEIEKLIEDRNSARKNRDFKKADGIRQKLKTFGIALEDRKEGTIWKREE